MTARPASALRLAVLIAGIGLAAAAALTDPAPAGDRTATADPVSRWSPALPLAANTWFEAEPNPSQAMQARARRHHRRLWAALTEGGAAARRSDAGPKPAAGEGFADILRRALRLVGLVRQAEHDALAEEHARLLAELAAARDAPPPAPPAAQDIERQRRIVTLLRRQIAQATGEIAFRTRRWQDAARAEGGLAAPARYGFASLELTPPDPPPPGPYHVKHYADRLTVSGLEAHRACWLELSCLQRLQSLPAAGAARFPAPVLLEAGAPQLTMTHQGWSLDIVPADRRPAIVALLRGETARHAVEIADALEAAGVAHLDPHGTGRNIVVDARGHVSLIDFDIAAIDGHAISAPIARRLDNWRNRGGYAATRRCIASLLTRFCDETDHR